MYFKVWRHSRRRWIGREVGSKSLGQSTSSSPRGHQSAAGAPALAAACPVGAAMDETVDAEAAAAVQQRVARIFAPEFGRQAVARTEVHVQQGVPDGDNSRAWSSRSAWERPQSPCAEPDTGVWGVKRLVTTRSSRVEKRSIADAAERAAFRDSDRRAAALRSASDSTASEVARGAAHTSAPVKAKAANTRAGTPGYGPAHAGEE